MATWREPRIDYRASSQVTPSIFNNLGENEQYLRDTKQDKSVSSTQATTRANLNATETVVAAFGKLRKWFADFGSLAWKSTVGQYDLESNCITQGKIATGAVTTGKIDGKAVTTIKLADGAVTDEKVSNVNANKLVNFYKKWEFSCYNEAYVDDLEEGVYLAFVVWHNRGSIPSCACCGTITYSRNMDNGSCSSCATISGNAEAINVKVVITDWTGRPRVDVMVSTDEQHFPDRYYEDDAGVRVVLYKICNLPVVSSDW